MGLGATFLVGNEAGKRTSVLDIGAEIDAQWAKSQRIDYRTFALWQPVGFSDGTDGQRFGIGAGVIELPAGWRLLGNRFFIEEHGALYYQQQNMATAIVDAVAGGIGIQVGSKIPLSPRLNLVLSFQGEAIFLINDLPSPQTYPETDKTQLSKTSICLKLGFLWGTGSK